MGWRDRSCLQKFLLILSILTVCVVVCIFAVNLAAAIKAGTQYWFTDKDDCGKLDDPADQATCAKYGCNGCTKKDEIFFYIFRVYTMGFSAMAVMAEFPKFKFFRESFQIFKYYWGRGFLQIFLGFLTITGQRSNSNDNSGETLLVTIFGFICLGFGVLHMVMSCLCFKAYGREVGKDDQEYASSEGSYSTA